MTNNELLDQLKVSLGEKIIQDEILYDCLVIEILPVDIYSTIEQLQQSDLTFQFVTLISGIHFPEELGRELCVVYHLHSWRLNLRFRIKCYLSQENPSIQSIVNLFPGANWMERETFDFFGIRFEGHPNLTRILNMDDMDYHPMLKQYHLEDGTREDKDDRFFGR